MYDKAKRKGYKLANFIHESVINNGFSIGENNIIFPGCVIEPFVEIGNNNIVWSMSLLGHDCRVGNHNYISAKCMVAGNAKVSDLCFIGNGVNMINRSGKTFNNLAIFSFTNILYYIIDA